MTIQFNSLWHTEPYILETDDSRSLHFTYLQTQSEMSVHQPDSLSLEYTRLMMGFLLFQKIPKTLLIIGLGGGSLAKFCYINLIQTKTTAVEINPGVIELRDAFNIPPDDDYLKVVLGDGSEFLKVTHRSFGTLLVDGYAADGIPSELCTQNFYDSCCSALLPGGIAVFNLDGYDPGYCDKVEKISNSFGTLPLQVSAATCANVVLFACNGKLKLDHSTCVTALSSEFKPQTLGPLLPALNRIRLAYKAQRGYGGRQSFS